MCSKSEPGCYGLSLNSRVLLCSQNLYTALTVADLKCVSIRGKSVHKEFILISVRDWNWLLNAQLIWNCPFHLKWSCRYDAAPVEGAHSSKSFILVEDCNWSVIPQARMDYDLIWFCLLGILNHNNSNNKNINPFYYCNCLNNNNNNKWWNNKVWYTYFLDQ